jgi:predicted DNA-binding transcriptional regulator AlpA
MRTTLEPEDINAIAVKVVEILLPLLHQQNLDELLTIDQVSELLHMSKGSIYQMVDKTKHGLSDFPYRKAGTKLLFSKNDILKWTTNG